MTLVVLGLDALDPELVDPNEHPNLHLKNSHAIETINSSAGEPSTHELWPTIITGLRPEEHGLVLDKGVAWENPLLRIGSEVADYVLPEGIQTQLGAWLLNNTSEDAFRTPASYYEENGIDTVFDGRDAMTIGIPNYVTDPDDEDREHQLRRRMGELFERNPEATTGHETADAGEFYELCMEMTMVRIARVRRALRGGRYELVFGYTSGLDLIGHVTYDLPELQMKAYAEINDFVGELRDDLCDDDELIIVSDHGLQDGIHTGQAIVAGTDNELVEKIESVTDVKDALEESLHDTDHCGKRSYMKFNKERSNEVEEHLESLGYM